MWRKTMLTVAVLLAVQVFITSQGLVIDPQAFAPATVHEVTYCLGQGGPVQMSDPFDPALKAHESFVGVVWSKDEDQALTLQEYTFSTEKVDLKVDWIQTYMFWGIQIPEVRKEHSGLYRATLQTLDSNSATDIRINLIVATPPALRSQKLDLKRDVHEDGSVTLSCGEIASFGDPEVVIMVKTSEGEVLNSSVSGGFVSATLPEDRGGSYTCEVDWSRSHAAECLSASARTAWEGSLLLPSTGSSADMTGIIIGVLVAVVVVIAIIILIVFLIKRKKGGKAYNTKSEEAKVEFSNGENRDPLLKELPENERPPIYKGANPYAVSGIKLPPNEPSHPGRAPMAGSEGSSPSPQSPSSAKSPPRAKPRSIFLTASQEAGLDTVGTAEPAPGTMV